MAVPEGTADPTADQRQMPTEVAGMAESLTAESAPAESPPAAADTTAVVPEEAPAEVAASPWLLPLVVGLGIALAALLLLTLLVRRRLPY
jgi:hypothetical protein